MDGFRIDYTVDGKRKEIDFKPQRERVTATDVVAAIMEKEKPGYQFGTKTAKRVLRDNGFLMLPMPSALQREESFCDE